MATAAAAGTEVDPLLGSSFVQRQQQQQQQQQQKQQQPKLFLEDTVDHDEMLREVVGLVDSLQDDFPVRNEDTYCTLVSKLFNKIHFLIFSRRP